MAPITRCTHHNRGQDDASGWEETPNDVWNVILSGDVFDVERLATHHHHVRDGVREWPGGSDGNEDFPRGCAHGCRAVFICPDAGAVEIEKLHRCLGDSLQNLLEVEGTRQDTAHLFQFLSLMKPPLQLFDITHVP